MKQILLSLLSELGRRDGLKNHRSWFDTNSRHLQRKGNVRFVGVWLHISYPKHVREGSVRIRSVRSHFPLVFRISYGSVEEMVKLTRLSREI